MQNIKAYMQQTGQQARAASRIMAQAGTNDKNRALEAIAQSIVESAAQLIAENARDVAAARANGLDAASVDRLTLTGKSISSMAEGLRQIAQLADPIGEISELKYRPSGIQVGRMRVPLGVIGIIYESRPNVTADAAGLCLKSGNAAILRGGSEAQDYYNAQSAADLLRRNDFDGRGNLSSSGLADFIRFWLQVCLDQVRFMGQMLALDSLQERFVGLAVQMLYDYGRGPLLHHRSKLRQELLGRALHRLFVEGKMECGEFKAMLDTSDRTATRVIGNLLEQRLVKSPSRLGAPELALSFFTLKPAPRPVTGGGGRDDILTQLIH